MRKSIIALITLVPFTLPSNGLSTVGILIKVPEGLVLAADSRATYKNKKGDYRIATDNAHKVFRLSKTCGCIISGGAFIDGQNVRSLIQEFKLKNRLDDKSVLGIDRIITRLTKFFSNKKGTTKFTVTGYDSDGRPKIFSYKLGQEEPIEKFANSTTVTSWVGLGFEAVERLLKGHDRRFSSDSILKLLDNALIGQIDSTQIITLKQDIEAAIANEFEGLECNQRIGKMALQDVVDFAAFLIRTTINYQKFTDGIVKSPGAIPTVGGPIDVAVITPQGFQWIQAKTLVGEAKPETH